jgi:copper(I)-binding protein
MHTRLIAVFAAVVSIASAVLPAHAGDTKLGDLTISQPWSRATPPGAKTGGGYLTITNAGKVPDRLVSVTASDVSNNVQLHEMGVADGVMTMRPLPDGVIVPAMGKVEFKPGGYHVMFMDLKSPLKKGDHIKATLTFEHAGHVDVDFDVGGIGQTAPGMNMKDMKMGHDMPM